MAIQLFTNQRKIGCKLRLRFSSWRLSSSQLTLAQARAALTLYCEASAQRALNGGPASAFCNPLQRLSKETVGSVGAMFTVVEGAFCCDGGIGSAVTVCCISEMSFLVESFVNGSLEA